MTDVSFTAPEIARRPRSPPGKKRGSTVCPSMVTTTSFPPTLREAPSSKASKPTPSRACLLLNPPMKSLFSRASMTEPPAPWASFTTSSLSEVIFRSPLFEAAKDLS